jgi:hypothetical protein
VHVDRLTLDGAIIQAPVSDREAVDSVLDEEFGENSPSQCREVYEKLVAMAKEMVSHGTTFDTILPLSLTSQLSYMNTPISARRFLSLVSSNSPQSPAEDDLFSADLSDERLAETFGMIQPKGLLRHKLMVAPSGSDQSVPG